MLTPASRAEPSEARSGSLGLVSVPLGLTKAHQSPGDRRAHAVVATSEKRKPPGSFLWGRALCQDPLAEKGLVGAAWRDGRGPLWAGCEE